MLMQYVSLYLNLFGYILGLYRFVRLYDVFHILHNYGWSLFELHKIRAHLMSQLIRFQLVLLD